jgi:hypothetical protein
MFWPLVIIAGLLGHPLLLAATFMFRLAAFLARQPQQRHPFERRDR